MSYLCDVQKIRIILLFSLVFSCHLLKAQPTLDTIRFCLTQKPHLFGKLDSRNSFIDNSLVNVFGIKAGIRYYKRLSFGIGYYQLYNPPGNFQENVYYINSFGKPYFIQKGLKMFYFAASVEYTFYQSKHWELRMPLQIGVGKTFYQYTEGGIKHKTNESGNFIYEPTISVDYKIVKWVGLSAGFGYRFMITANRKLNKQFNSPIVSFGIAIYYSEIVKSLFPKSKLAKKM